MTLWLYVPILGAFEAFRAFRGFGAEDARRFLGGIRTISCCGFDD
jgi:hypothetical protein